MATKPVEKKPSTISVRPHDETYDVIVSIPKALVFTVVDIGDTELDMTKVHSANIARWVIRGAYERFKDVAAVNRADAEGNIIPKPEHNRIKAERLNDLAIHYESGTEQYSRKAERTTRDDTSLVVQAIMRVKGWTEERVNEMLETHCTTMKMERKAALKYFASGPKVINAMAAIRAERAGGDSDEMLDAMD